MDSNSMLSCVDSKIIFHYEESEKLKTNEEIILNKMLLAEAIKLEILQLMNCDDFKYLEDLKQTILLLSKDYFFGFGNPFRGILFFGFTFPLPALSSFIIFFLYAPVGYLCFGLLALDAFFDLFGAPVSLSLPYGVAPAIVPAFIIFVLVLLTLHGVAVSGWPFGVLNPSSSRSKYDLLFAIYIGAIADYSCPIMI